MPFLSELRIGQSGRIVRFDEKLADAQRFLEMGLTPGAQVKVLRFAPLGDPIEILVRGTHLSLRRLEAAMIQLELL